MKLGLRCFGQTLNVCTTSPQVFTYLSSLDHLFSLPAAVTEYSEGGPCLNIVEGSPAKVTFEPLSRSLTFRVEWALIDQSNAIASLLAQLLCLACIDAGTYIFHAAAVSKEEAAYLLVGGVGAGKTSLSMALCSNSKFKWISNDHVALLMSDKGIILCEGHDLTDFRKLSFPLEANFLSQSMVEKIRSRFPSNSTPWAKTEPPFSASELALLQAGLPCSVKSLFFPLVGLTTYECFQEMPLKRSTTTLLQMLTWPLEGVETFLLDNSGKVICPSVAIEPTGGWAEAYNFVNSLVSLCPAYIVHGTLEYVVQSITVKISELEIMDLSTCH